jgi:hypothetical protein
MNSIMAPIPFLTPEKPLICREELPGSTILALWGQPCAVWLFSGRDKHCHNGA